MNHWEAPLSHQAEPLAGSWHGLGPLELRRLILEAATVVLEVMSSEADGADHGSTMNFPILDRYVSAQTMAARFPDREIPIVCLCPDWKPAQKLAERLSAQGYKHVFTAATHWSGIVAMGAAAASDQLSSDLEG